MLFKLRFTYDLSLILRTIYKYSKHVIHDYLNMLEITDVASTAQSYLM